MFQECLIDGGEWVEREVQTLLKGENLGGTNARCAEEE
jgi:hypothetical protein